MKAKVMSVIKKKLPSQHAITLFWIIDSVFIVT